MRDRSDRRQGKFVRSVDPAVSFPAVEVKEAVRAGALPDQTWSMGPRAQGGQSFAIQGRTGNGGTDPVDGAWNRFLEDRGPQGGLM